MVLIKEKQRDSFFDFLRGIAIVMVIGIHTYVDDPLHFNLFVRQFLNCAVPIFLAISGYFIGRKNFTIVGSYTAFLKKQISRVYIPMLIWSMPWLILALHHGESFSTSFQRVIVGDMSMGMFYFIILIMQYYALTPIIKKVNVCLGGGKYAVVITFISISMLDYILRIKGMAVSNSGSVGLFPVWLIFYVMGVLKAQNMPLPFYCKKTILLAMLAIFMCCLQILLIYEINSNVVHGIKLSSHIYSFFVVMWIFSNKARNFYVKIQNFKFVEHLIVIGRMSFFIYLTHALFLYAFSHISFPNFWSLRFVFCLCLSYGIALLFERLCPSKMKKYVGF